MEQKPEIKFKTVHEEIIESTIPVSNKMIDDGETESFMLNCDEQTAGRGSGDRKWVTRRGNVFTTFNLREEFLPKEIKNVAAFLIGISICEKLNEISTDKFCIKWPNDVLCKDEGKVCGILVDKYKNFYQLSFGVNLVDCPEVSEMRKGGRNPCHLGKHVNVEKIPNALKFSEDICKNICEKINKLSAKEIMDEWKKNANFNIKITKRGDTSEKEYQPLEVNEDGWFKVKDDEGKEEVIQPMFPYLNKP